MGIRQRLGGIMSGVVQTVARPVVQRLSAPYLWLNYGADTPHWQMIDYASYVTEGFQRNALIYAAIMYKAKAMSATRMVAYRGDSRHPEFVEDGHPLARLLRRPNQHQSWVEFESLNTQYLNISGNAYVMLDRERGGDVPAALYPLRPDRVRILPERNGIKGYLYLPDGVSTQNAVPILPEDMMHVKFTNPYDDLEGMGYGQSPLMAAAQSADVDNNITRYLKLFFERGAMPSGLLKFNVPLDDESLSRVKRRWMEIYGGVDNWSDVGVLDSGGDYQKLAMTMNEMGFDGLDERNEARLLSVIGVPSVLIDTRLSAKASTYNNKETARRAFWEDTMLYEMALWDAEYDAFLSAGDVRVMRDISRVPALQKNMPELVKAAREMWSMGVPANVAFEAVGIRLEDVPTGEVGYVPAGVVRVDGETPIPDPSPPTEEARNEPHRPLGRGRAYDTGQPHNDGNDGQMASFGAKMQDHEGKIGTEFLAWTDEQKVALGERVEALVASRDEDAMGAVREALGRDLREIGARMQRGQTRALEQRATIDWLSVGRDIKQYLAEEAPLGWRESFVPIFAGVIGDVGDFWAVELGLQFDVRNVLGEAWFADYTLVFSKPINQTTSNAIQLMLAKGQEEGWTILKMQDNLEALFRQWLDGDMSPSDFAWLEERLPPHRTEMIARTETIRAAGVGSQELFRAWGMEKREWLATGDDRTRPSHRAASGQVRDIDEPFSVGGYAMMHPGDGSLGADVGEIVNCRCTLLPVME